MPLSTCTKKKSMKKVNELSMDMVTYPNNDLQNQNNYMKKKTDSNMASSLWDSYVQT